jgi:hypothetical protein
LTNADATAARYILEKADSKGQYTPLSIFTPLHRDTLLHTYIFEDTTSAEGLYQYSIKLELPSGDFNLSAVREVRLAAIANLTLFPNPVADRLGVSLANYINRKVSLSISNASGLVLKEIQVEPREQRSLFELNVFNLGTGYYYLHITTPNRRSTSRVFLIGR